VRALRTVLWPHGDLSGVFVFHQDATSRGLGGYGIGNWRLLSNASPQTGYRRRPLTTCGRLIPCWARNVSRTAPGCDSPSRSANGTSQTSALAPHIQALRG